MNDEADCFPASLEVKSKAPNGVNFNVKGKSAHEGPIAGAVSLFILQKTKTNNALQLEAKYADPPTGKPPKRKPPDRRTNKPMVFFSCGRFSNGLVNFSLISSIVNHAIMLMISPFAGLTLTQTWTTANALDTKLELDNNIAKGLKAEILTQYLPAKQSKGAKLNLHFKQPNLHARAFFDLLNGPTANFDAVLGHEGFLVGAESGYDVQKAAITKYAAAIGYSVPQYSAAVTAGNNLSVFSASYYHRVNEQVEAGAKATWDSKAGNSVGLEVASKYRLDPSSFAKVFSIGFRHGTG